MDRSLVLLIKLRCLALLRRWKKLLSTPKGIILALMTAMIFVPWLFSMIVTARIDVKPPVEQIHRFAPLGILIFTLVSLLFTAGEQVLYFSPAEVTFLFAGPYRRRQLLAYKLLTTVLLSFFSAAFFALSSRMIAPNFFAALVGFFFLMLFLQLFQMALGLGASTLGALAWSRGRRLILVGVLLVVGLAILSVGRELAGVGLLEALQRIESSPVARVVLMPFRWFVLAFTARRIWPEMIQWSSLCAACDALLLALIFALDSSYLEAASNSSAKRFAKLQRLRGGGGGLRSISTRKVGRFHFRPPSPPWWGGVGPNFWRQMTGALGDPIRMIGVVLMLAITPVVLIFVTPNNPQQAAPMPYVSMGMIAWMSIILSFLIPYDFRGDIDLMEELKALPITPSRLALGQLLTPTLLATVGQILSMIVVLVGLGGRDYVAWTFLAFLLPVNFLFYAIENLLFLWYPSRIVAGSFDVMAVGRQVLFMLAKVIGLATGSGLAILVGLLMYFVAGRNLYPAIAAAWLAMVACSLSLVPLVGQAFAKLDVSSDIPA